MTANENPAIPDGASDDTYWPGSRFHDYIAPQLSSAANKWLNEWCDALADGTVSLAQLPLPVVSVYLLGYAHAEFRYSCNHADRIARLEYERDLYYWLASNPGKSGADFLKFQTNALWAEGVAA